MPDDEWRELIESSIAERRPPPPSPNGSSPSGSSSRDRAYALAGLRKECDILAAMPPDSGRNSRLNNAIFSLAGFVPQALSEEEVVDSLGAAAAYAGLPLSEIASTVRSALRGSRAKGVTRTAPPKDAEGDWMRPGASTANESASAGAGPDISTGAPDDDNKTLEEIEEDFWTARDAHQLVYTAALSRMASPWAVFGCCVARIMCLIPPAVTLPPLIGDRGSLNWFGVIAAKSGGGKGIAMSVARLLVPKDVLVCGIGSGEGMIEIYDRGPKKGDDPPPPVVAVLFSVDEIDSLGAMANKKGQTTMAILRQGFSGEDLGYSYRGRQKEKVAAHTYRMTMVTAVQPSRAGILLDDSGGGTPQRFMWFPGRDRRITDDVPPWPVDNLAREKPLPLIPDWQMANAVGIVEVPDLVRREVRAARAASMRGDDNALDGHALYCREKFAYALAYLDGRTAMDLEDWRLAGIASQVSDWTRAKVIRWHDETKQEEARQRGVLRGVELCASDTGRVREQRTQAERLADITQRVWRVIQEAGPEGISNRDLQRNRFSGRSGDRDLMKAALTYWAGEGKIRMVEGTNRWVVCS